MVGPADYGWLNPSSSKSCPISSIIVLPSLKTGPTRCLAGEWRQATSPLTNDDRSTERPSASRSLPTMGAGFKFSL